MSFQIDADFHKDRKQEKDSISINPPTAEIAFVSDAHYVAGTKIDNTIITESYYPSQYFH